jgi:filamentous hemagglutinin
VSNSGGNVASDGIPQTSGATANSAAGAALREDLARQAGIPRGLDNVWGADLADLKASYKMDRWAVTDKAPRVNSSGNAQVFTVDGPADGSVAVKQVQFSPSTEGMSVQSQHVGQYYKFSYTDGSTVKVIDPSSYVVKGWPESNTTFYNQTGTRIIYDPASKTWKN